LHTSITNITVGYLQKI